MLLVDLLRDLRKSQRPVVVIGKYFLLKKVYFFLPLDLRKRAPSGGDRYVEKIWKVGIAKFLKMQYIVTQQSASAQWW